MTRPNQGLSSLALGGGERESLGTRLGSSGPFAIFAATLIIFQAYGKPFAH